MNWLCGMLLLYSVCSIHIETGVSPMYIPISVRHIDIRFTPYSEKALFNINIREFDGLISEREIEPIKEDTTASPSVTDITSAPETEPIVNGICQNDGVTSDWVNRVNSNLSVVPANLIQRFKSEGWRMYCTTKNLDRTYFGGQFGAVMGVTLYEEKLIYIEDRWDAVTESPVHEFGHYLDSSLGYITSTSEFRSIFNAEQSTFRSVYGVPSYFTEEELFAEAFWRYLTSSRDKLNMSCPRLTKFIEDAIARAN